MAKEYKYSIMIVEKDGTASLMGISALTFAEVLFRLLFHLANNLSQMVF
jgi:hypothetical protein